MELIVYKETATVSGSSLLILCEIIVGIPEFQSSFLGDYSKGALDISRLTTVIINGQEVELYRVASGESKCAGVSKVDNRLYYFPNDNCSHGFPFKDIPSEDKNLANLYPLRNEKQVYNNLNLLTFF